MSHLKSKQEIGLFMVIQQALFLKITILAHRFMLSTILAWITLLADSLVTFFGVNGHDRVWCWVTLSGNDVDSAGLSDVFDQNIREGFKN